MRRLLLCTFALVALGCDQEDAKRLAQVGRWVGQRTQNLTAQIPRPNAPPPAAQPLPAIVSDSVADRVRLRFKLDKTLGPLPITVQADGRDGVKLTGQLKKLTQRRRAVEIAQTTAGVENVVDELLTPDVRDE